MRANVSGRVKNTVLPKTKGLLPLFEAITNSFQAIEECKDTNKSHYINVEIHRHPNLDTKNPPIESFTITDSGIGFTDQNFNSFNTADSDYKATKGGKGIGRFLWLKAFEKVEIESYYKSSQSNDLQKRQIVFTVHDDVQAEVLPNNHDDKESGTTVRLIDFSENYRASTPNTLETIARDTIQHFLLQFMDEHTPTVSMRDEQETLNLNEIFKGSYQRLVTPCNFSLKDKIFKLTNFKFIGSSANHKLIYSAHQREVLSESLDKYIPNLTKKLIDEDHKHIAYVCVLESEYLDHAVNTERTHFSMPDDVDSNPLFKDVLAKDEIRYEAIKLIEAEVRPYLTTVISEKKDQVISYIQQKRPRYRLLLKNMDHWLDEIKPDVSEEVLESFLNKKLCENEIAIEKEKTDILKSSKNIMDTAEYSDRLNKLMSNINELEKSDLATYVAHRRLVLELLENSLGYTQTNPEYALEKDIHNIFFEMGKNSDDVRIEQQNLWLIDEKLTYHTFLTSDKSLRTANKNKIISNSQERPDLFIYDQGLAFSDGSYPLSSIVLVEFKRPMRDDHGEEDPLRQIARILDSIRDSTFKDDHGRSLNLSDPETTPAYCYVICDITNGLKKSLKPWSPIRKPNGIGYYGYSPSYRMYYEVMPLSSVLEDAKKRNRILFDKLHIGS